MAKATTPASEKPASKPRAPRKAVVKASDADTTQDAGAIAPVSSSGDQTAQAATPSAPRAEFFPGMGRFPPDWKPAQTPEKEPAVEDVQSSAWGLPEIAEFPVELLLVNNTRNILVVRSLNTRLTQFGTAMVQCPTAEHYEAIERELVGRALRERWDYETGLQVTYGGNQG